MGLLRNWSRAEYFRHWTIAGAEALVDFALVTARLKPCPYYKTGIQRCFVTACDGARNVCLTFNPWSQKRDQGHPRKEVCPIPSIRQKEDEWMGHGAVVWLSIPGLKIETGSAREKKCVLSHPFVRKKTNGWGTGLLSDLQSPISKSRPGAPAKRSVSYPTHSSERRRMDGARGCCLAFNPRSQNRDRGHPAPLVARWGTERLFDLQSPISKSRPGAPAKRSVSYPTHSSERRRMDGARGCCLAFNPRSQNRDQGHPA